MGGCVSPPPLPLPLPLPTPESSGWGSKREQHEDIESLEQQHTHGKKEYDEVVVRWEQDTITRRKDETGCLYILYEVYSE